MEVLEPRNILRNQQVAGSIPAGGSIKSITSERDAGLRVFVSTRLSLGTKLVWWYQTKHFRAPFRHSGTSSDTFWTASPSIWLCAGIRGGLLLTHIRRVAFLDKLGSCRVHPNPWTRQNCTSDRGVDRLGYSRPFSRFLNDVWLPEFAFSDVMRSGSGHRRALDELSGPPDV
jgi:hypothetical protein